MTLQRTGRVGTAAPQDYWLTKKPLTPPQPASPPSPLGLKGRSGARPRVLSDRNPVACACLCRCVRVCSLPVIFPLPYRRLRSLWPSFSPLLGQSWGMSFGLSCASAYVCACVCVRGLRSPFAEPQPRQEAVIRAKRRLNTRLALPLSQEQSCHVQRLELLITSCRDNWGISSFFWGSFASLMLLLFTFLLAWVLLSGCLAEQGR